VVKTRTPLVEGLRTLQVRELVNSDKRSAHQPHDVVKRASVLVNDGIRTEQTLIPRSAAVEIAYGDSDVGDRGELGHQRLLAMGTA
jgi:hypothetical protein